jgi:TolB-like protein
MVAFTFIDHLLDVERRELRRAGEPVALEPQVFDLLLYLVVNRERVVGKDELIDSVWGGRIVSDSAVTTRINAARRAVGDNGSEQRIIRTIQRKGMRFVAEVKEEAIPTAAASMAPVPAQPALPLPDKPSIAVLPFQNLSGDPEQEYFADGMVEEIITALCRIRWLFVIARNSTLAYKGRAFDLKQVGRELGVRYVLDGSVRKVGNRVRITAQLIEADSGAHLWTDRFDGALEDVFELQDKAAISVAGVIEPTLQAAETDRSTGRPTADLTAYDLYLRSYATVWSSASRIREALKLAEQAIARDPRYGMALAWAAFCCLRLLLDGQSEDRQEDRRKGADYARRALAAADDDPGTLSNAAQALAYFGEDIGAMMALVDRALVLNPSYARGWMVSGLLRVWAGQPDLGIEHTREALRLSPRGRNGAPYSIIGLAHFFARRFAEAVPNLLLSIQEDPTDPRPYRNLAACYAHLGRIEEARAMVARVRDFTDDVIPPADYLRNPEHRALFLSGMRLASGEED